MATATLVLVLFFGTMLMGMPLAYSMLFTGFVSLHFMHPEISPIIVPQRVFGGVNNFILLCIPFFIMAGDLMSMTKLFDQLINVANAIIGRVKGALSHIVILVAMFFAGITGAATADTSAVGSLLIPAMVKQGYRKQYATAVTVVASTIGVIIPPSNLMIVAALATSTSVAVLLLGGIIPGVLAAMAMLVWSVYYGIKHGFPAFPPMSWRERLWIFWRSLPALGIPVILMGGVLSGVVTPTEAADVSIFYALTVGPALLRRFPTAKQLQESSLMVVGRVSAVMSCVGASLVLGWIFAISEVPEAVGRFISSITTNAVLIVAGMLVTYLIVGCFMDPIPAILIFSPIFQPLAESVGMSPEHFAVVMVFGMTIGLATPPVGSCLYVGAAISGLRIDEFTLDMIPYIVAMTIILFVIAYIPSLVLLIPNLMLRR
ncbi:MAG TPA: TRAP transporter large permease [archaeon]|nr:TRAP transporter large permease [archaeon]